MFRHLAILTALLTTACQAAQEPPRASHTALLEALQPIRELHQAQKNTGYVFAVTVDGEKVLEDFAGQAIVEHDVSITPRSRFPVMSVTKAFTGAALARAVTLELVNLDTPVSDYLTDYDGEGKDEITLRMLMSHTSGIPHTGHPQRRELYVRHFASAVDAIQVFQGLPLANTPGATYQYSSSGYNLVAAILESVAGMDFELFVAQQVLMPLGLADTGFTNVQRPTPDLVRNYSYVDIWDYSALKDLAQVPTWDFSYNRGGGNMYSTVDDLLSFGNALLKAGVFSNAELALMREPIMTGTDLGPWSAGWIVGADESGRRTVHITGATPGVQASLYIYPDDNLVFAMLANCWGQDSANGALVIDAPKAVVAKLLAIRSGT